ncbi:M14 family metallopeptidase [Candidatus Viridilinea mediisalina]|nr:M14 family metallopeptidase [Candidatus Viridilinea mediisalina]
MVHHAAPLRNLLLMCSLLMLLLGGFVFAAAPVPQASATAAAPREFIVGYSAQGRPISAVQFGTGPRKLVVVGNTHGAPEANTYRLTLALIEHLRAHPELVPDSVRLFLIPTVNPDGMAIGWRFDAAGVDLNRNMNTNIDACPENDWQITVQGAYGFISDTGGPYPDSQVESQLVRAFLIDAAGAIFLHSNAGLVFPAACEHQPSIRLAEVYAEAAGYNYSRYWPFYHITGGMHDWAGGLGIAAITPELVTGDQIEFEENLAALSAVLDQADELLPLPEDGEVAGVPVPATIYRYWRALGGEERFGVPIEPARSSATGVSQTFQHVRIGLQHAQRDTLLYVQPEPLGVAAAEGLAYGGAGARTPHEQPPSEGIFFPETGYSINGNMRSFWLRGGGLTVFGLPLSHPFQDNSNSEQPRTLQYFERALFSYTAETGVQLKPLGVRTLALEELQQPNAAQMVR